jgi:basic membrane lipoprotein Med (substrate-binding protein (PBP1-ABC) superfamily)
MRAILFKLFCLSLSLFAAPLPAGEQPAKKVPVVFAAYATPLEEPWNMVIHDALQAAQRGGRIRYAWQDNLADSPQLAAALAAEVAKRPDIVFVDGTLADAEIRQIAAANPQTAFVVGTSNPPAAPNLSVFDTDLCEPAYLCGVLAGRLTKSNVVGVVCGKPEPHVHRTVNAYIQGARDANQAVKVKVTFIDSWFDPPKAHQAALDQIAAGADLIYAEREGAIAAAREKGVLAFGNLLDQHGESPTTVITGPVWSMTPVVDYLISLSSAGKVHAENLIDFSTLARGGAALAPWHGWDGRLPTDVMQLVREKERALKSGTLVLKPSTERPTGD